MDKLREYQRLVGEARTAIQRGDPDHAYQLAQNAAGLIANREDAWLILAALVEPDKSLDYIHKALEANPESSRARRGLEWARKRLEVSSRLESVQPVQPAIKLHDVDQEQIRESSMSVKHGGMAPGVRKKTSRRRRRTSLLPLLFVILGCFVFGFAGWSAVTSPVMSSLLGTNLPPSPAQDDFPHFARVEIPKPAGVASALETTLLPTPTLVESQASSPSGNELSVVIPTAEEMLHSMPDGMVMEYPSVTPTVLTPAGPTETPGVMMAELVPDTPTPEYVPPTDAPPAAPLPAQASSGGGGHWIDVDLSQQRLYAYAGDTLMNSFLVSTGTWQTPTVMGKYKVWIKLRYSDMTGPGYFLPDVPYVMYFYGDYGIHGTYWHNNFGTPMSHGCVNLSIPDAAWLYDFSAVGTTVNVHY